MDSHEARITRRRGLAWGSHLVIGAAVISVAGKPLSASAAKADKRDFFYQDMPKDGKSCATCRLYAVTEAGKGQCAIVDGDVSPSGWCMAYSPRG
jgi:High potential iron-sulfur protein